MPKVVLGALTIAAAIHNPGEFVSALESPSAAASLLAQEPFDSNDFDVDGFVISQELADKIPRVRGARWVDSQNSPELAKLQKSIDTQLRQSLKGLRAEKFTFRVYTPEEYLNDLNVM